jgi:hypothetical protein
LCSQVRTRFGSRCPRSFALQSRRERTCVGAAAASSERVGRQAARVACTRIARVSKQQRRVLDCDRAFGPRHSHSSAAARSAAIPENSLLCASSREFLTGPDVVPCGAPYASRPSLARVLSWECHDSARRVAGRRHSRRGTSTNTRMHALRRRQGRASSAIHCRRQQRVTWWSPERAAEIGPMSELTPAKWFLRWSA